MAKKYKTIQREHEICKTEIEGPLDGIIERLTEYQKLYDNVSLDLICNDDIEVLLTYSSQETDKERDKRLAFTKKECKMKAQRRANREDEEKVEYLRLHKKYGTSLSKEEEDFKRWCKCTNLW